MTNPELPIASSVDVVFPVEGSTLPRDHAQGLLDALCTQWPWLKTEAHSGVHNIKLVQGLSTQAMLSRRTKLLLRVPTHRAPELLGTTAVELFVAGQSVSLGAPHRRELLAHTTLYAYNVAATSEDEVAFMAEVTKELTELGIGGERVCGKSHQLTIDGNPVNTFSLMLHALAPEHSLRVQCHGIGPHRLLGCGIFIPHKSAAAV
jgi:CRISPR-associated protein Cas6